MAQRWNPKTILIKPSSSAATTAKKSSALSSSSFAAGPSGVQKVKNHQPSILKAPKSLVSKSKTTKRLDKKPRQPTAEELAICKMKTMNFSVKRLLKEDTKDNTYKTLYNPIELTKSEVKLLSHKKINWSNTVRKKVPLENGNDMVSWKPGWEWEYILRGCDGFKEALEEFNQSKKK